MSYVKFKKNIVKNGGLMLPFLISYKVYYVNFRKTKYFFDLHGLIILRHFLHVQNNDLLNMQIAP